jgi:hypothetical protein
LAGVSIPFFILHWPSVWPLVVAKPNRFNFFALSLGSIMPDLEVPILFLITGDKWHARSIMHSLLGAVTIDLLIVVLATIFIVPWFLNYLDGKLQNKKIFLFSSFDLREHKTSTGVIIYSGLIGTVSHVCLDTIHHTYNPLLFPFEEYYGFNLILFNDLQLMNIVVWIVMSSLLIVMLYYWYLKKLL